MLLCYVKLAGLHGMEVMHFQLLSANFKTMGFSRIYTHTHTHMHTHTHTYTHTHMFMHTLKSKSGALFLKCIYVLFFT